MDVATIGLDYDPSGANAAKSDLQNLVPAAEKASKASAKLSDTLSRVDAAADKLAAAAAGLSTASDRMSAAMNKQTGSAAALVAEYGSMVNMSVKYSTATMNASKAASGAVAANNAQAASLKKVAAAAKLAQAASSGSSRVGGKGGADTPGKLRTDELLNFSRQLSDVGVTAAMGMNPLMILIQQGPQIADIFQSAAQRGIGFNAVLGQILGKLAPLAAMLGVIAVVIGAVAAGYSLAAREFNKGSDSIVKSLNLTSDQMDKLKEKGTNLNVTMGDAFKGYFMTIGDILKTEFGGQLKWLDKAWNDTLDLLVKAWSDYIKFALGTFMAFFAVLKVNFKFLPAVIGDAFISGVNIAIKAINWLDDKIVGFVNSLGGSLKGLNLGLLDNPNAGAMNDYGKAAVEAASKAYKDGAKFVDNFGIAWEKNARKVASNRILKDAGKPDKASKGPKSESAKFEDIITGANADIATQNARKLAAGIDVTALASATLEEKTKLLNAAQAKGITLTDARRKKIDELADAFGRAKVAADDAVFLHDIMKTGDADLAAIQAQTDMIGLYGRELAYATEKAKLFAEAKSKGMSPDAIKAATPGIEAAAGKVADASATKDADAFMEAQTQAYVKNTQALQMQRAEIGLTADEMTRYEYEQKAINDALDQHIKLTPQDIDVLKKQADAQADAAIANRKMTDSLNNAKDAAKGFISDLRSGLESGKSLWQSFGDAVQGVLNKIIDKLTDKVLSDGIDALFKKSSDGGGSGGGADILSNIFSAFSASAKGNAFDMYAKGGTFTNKIVDKPTMFAHGGGLGIMGEKTAEAIMPLKRGPDGNLGIRAYDKAGSGQRGSSQNNINVDNHYMISGAVSAKDIVALTQASAEQTKQDVKQSLTGWLQTIREDGTTV